MCWLLQEIFFVDMNDEAIEVLCEQVKVQQQAYSLVTSSRPQHKSIDIKVLDLAEAVMPAECVCIASHAAQCDLLQYC